MSPISLLTSDDTAAMRLTARGDVAVRRLSALLRDVEHAYDSALLFDSLLWDHRETVIARWHALSRPALDADRVSRSVPAGDRLVVRGVRLESPGFWEFLGKLNPLEVLRLYLDDRHRRRQDRAYREKAEARRLTLENQVLELAIVRERLSVAAKNGVPPEILAEAADLLLVEPLERVGRQADDGLIDAGDVAVWRLSP